MDYSLGRFDDSALESDSPAPFTTIYHHPRHPHSNAFYCRVTHNFITFAKKNALLVNYKIQLAWQGHAQFRPVRPDSDWQVPALGLGLRKEFG